MTMSDSEEDGLWDWLLTQKSEKKSIQPVPKIPLEGTAETPIQKPTVRSERNVKLRRNPGDVITKKYPRSRSKLSTSDAKPQHASNTRELTEEEIKQINLSEELKEIKMKVERAKSNREQLRQIYEERMKSDPHKDKRHLSFDELRGEYVG